VVGCVQTLVGFCSPPASTCDAAGAATTGGRKHHDEDEEEAPDNLSQLQCGAHCRCTPRLRTAQLPLPSRRSPVCASPDRDCGPACPSFVCGCVRVCVRAGTCGCNEPIVKKCANLLGLRNLCGQSFGQSPDKCCFTNCCDALNCDTATETCDADHCQCKPKPCPPPTTEPLCKTADGMICPLSAQQHWRHPRSPLVSRSGTPRGTLTVLVAVPVCLCSGRCAPVLQAIKHTHRSHTARAQFLRTTRRVH
jgi:hypothetical protein